VNREPGIEKANREPGTGNREPDRAESAFAEDGRSLTDHRDLDVWKLSMSFATDVYKTTAAFPADEKFGLVSQLRRAAVSIPTNIAEGNGRETSGSYLQFLRIAQGSAKELQTLIELSSRLGLLDRTSEKGLGETLERIAQMLFRLIRAIERRKGR